MFNKFLDTLNKIIGVLAFLGINGYIVKKYFYEIGVFLKKYYLEIIIFQFFLLLMFFIILYVLFKKVKNNKVDIRVNYNEILNKKIFEKFLKDRKSLFSAKLAQLQKGYIKLYGKEVKDVQVSLIDYLYEFDSNDRVIKTVDLTTNPELWLTRKEYMEKNRLLIENGGKIFRILVIDVKNLKYNNFKENLIKLCKKFLEIGVNLRICDLRNLSSEEAEDFIIYDTFAVLVENKQADEEYKLASSTLYFDKTTFDAFNKKFESVYNKSKLINNETELKKII